MLTERQTEIVNGSLLGDGTIWTNFIDSNLKWQMCQSKRDIKGVDKKSYILWYVKEFLNLGVSVRESTVKPSGMIKENSEEREYQRYSIYTRRGCFWKDIESIWYVPHERSSHYKRRKIIPNELRLTPLTLCVWHMDDGSSSQKDANIELNTQGFTPDEVDFLIDRLDKDLGVSATRKTGGRKPDQFKIYVGTRSYFKFIDIIKPHVEWDCFAYKIDTSQYDKIPQIGENHSQAKFTNEDVREIFRLRDSGMLQREIAEQLDINRTSVSLILSGKQWGHLGMIREAPKRPKLTNEKKQQIFVLAMEGLTHSKIAAEVGVDQSTVCRTLQKGNK